jgi:hypothetical protein
MWHWQKLLNCHRAQHTNQRSSQNIRRPVETNDNSSCAHKDRDPKEPPPGLCASLKFAIKEKKREG